MRAKPVAQGLAILVLNVLVHVPIPAAQTASPRTSDVQCSSDRAASDRPASLQDPAVQHPPTPSSPQPPPPGAMWSDRISLSGFLAGDGRWRRTGSEAPVTTTTDLYLRAFELGVEADIADWLLATAVISSEYIGDPLNGGDSLVTVDEAHLDITVPRTPIYFVLGKRIQPFGLFETYLVTDLLVQDAYETKAVGLTGGVKAPRETDLSITAYKGRSRSDHLGQSGVLGPAAPDFPEVPVARADSWIISGVSSPAGGGWRISAAFASEPGVVRRSTTLNLGSDLRFPWYKQIEFNAEYMKAVRRDDVPGLGRSFLERVLSATISYLMVTQGTQQTAGRNYRARKSRRLAHPAVVAIRFEALDDGGRAETMGAWSIRNRISAGGRYTFYGDGNVQAALTLECRRQTVRVSTAFEGPVPSTHEIYLRFGLDF